MAAVSVCVVHRGQHRVAGPVPAYLEPVSDQALSLIVHRVAGVVIGLALVLAGMAEGEAGLALVGAGALGLPGLTGVLDAAG